MSTCVSAAAVSKVGDALLTAALLGLVAVVHAAAFDVRARPLAPPLGSELHLSTACTRQAQHVLLLQARDVATGAPPGLIAPGHRLARGTSSTAVAPKHVRAHVSRP